MSVLALTDHTTPLHTGVPLLSLHAGEHLAVRMGVQRATRPRWPADPQRADVDVVCGTWLRAQGGR